MLEFEPAEPNDYAPELVEVGLIIKGIAQCSIRVSLDYYYRLILLWACCYCCYYYQRHRRRLVVS